MLKLCAAAFAGAALIITGAAAQQRPDAAVAKPDVVRAIAPPATPLPGEAESSGVTRFSFIAYGDTRGQADGAELQANHTSVIDAMRAKIAALASTPAPVRFIVQSGDAVVNGRIAAQWNVSFTPIIERLTQGANLPYFFSVGNHDVTGMPVGDAQRAAGVANAVAAMASLIPAEGSPRRLKGYPTYAFGYGNLFAIAIDSNIAADLTQLAWVKDQLEHLDRGRFRHVIAFFHHPPFSSGPHGGDTIEPATASIRRLYLPLFRTHQVGLTLTGHDHLFDHWVEHYVHDGRPYRRDDIVSGGGGAPLYAYRGEPDLRDYTAAYSDARVRVEHLARPGRTTDENPHHFFVIEVDGERLTAEIVPAGNAKLAPYNGRSRVVLSDRAS
jgi:hypothetical protein